MDGSENGNVIHSTKNEIMKSEVVINVEHLENTLLNGSNVVNKHTNGCNATVNGDLANLDDDNVKMINGETPKIEVNDVPMTNNAEFSNSNAHGAENSNGNVHGGEYGYGNEHSTAISNGNVHDTEDDVFHGTEHSTEISNGNVHDTEDDVFHGTEHTIHGHYKKKLASYNDSPPRSPLKSMDSNFSENEDLPTYLPRSRKINEIGSENLITNDDLRLAATLVADAMEGQTYELQHEPRFVRSYNLFISPYLRFPMYLVIMVNICLSVCEEPAVEQLQLPYYVTMSVEGLCLIFLICRLCHHAHWRLGNRFKKDVKNITAIICIVITVGDMVAYVVVREVLHSHAVRWSRALRAFLIITFSDGTHLRRAWNNIRLTLNQIVHVIVLFYFLIVVFSLVAMKMFQFSDDIVFPDGSAYFKNYLESFWQLYVLVTTANNPDVMMPAYEKNRWYCLFFTIYIILCLYLMLNILLAVTYYSYRENMKNQIIHSARMKTKILHQAFEKIKINVDRKEMVTYKTWTRLIKLAHPGKTKYQIDLLMMVLDTDKSGYISREQFLLVADLLNVPVSEVSERKTFLELHIPKIYLSKISQLMIRGINTIYFSLFYDGVVIVNVIIICLNIDVADWLFLALYVLEIFLKWYAHGTKRYFINFQHMTDVIITLVSLIVLLLYEFAEPGMINSETLSVLNVFRIFRVLRCLVEFDRFKIIFDAVFNVSFSILTYCGILFMVFYVFGIMGMEIFAGKIAFIGYNRSNYTDIQLNCNNSLLNGSLFVSNHYCKMNFNDLINSFVLLASLLIVNNWHVICEGFVLVTSSGARVYFMLFHLCVAVVVMNIVTAFILDMFMHEYTFSKKGNIDTKVEQTIKSLNIGIDDETGMDIEETSPPRRKYNRSATQGMFHTTSMFRRLTLRQGAIPKPNLSRYDGIRFHIKKRGWTKTELLLQQLFELEDHNHHSDDLHSDIHYDLHSDIHY